MEEKFAVGDEVTWADRDLSPIHSYVEKYGKGSFKVIKVRIAEGGLGFKTHPQEVTLEAVTGALKIKVCKIGLRPPVLVWVNCVWLKQSVKNPSQKEGEPLRA